MRRSATGSVLPEEGPQKPTRPSFVNCAAINRLGGSDGNRNGMRSLIKNTIELETWRRYMSRFTDFRHAPYQIGPRSARRFAARLGPKTASSRTVPDVITVRAWRHGCPHSVSREEPVSESPRWAEETRKAQNRLSIPKCAGLRPGNILTAAEKELNPAPSSYIQTCSRNVKC